MIRMNEKMFVNDDLEIELTSFIDKQQNVCSEEKMLLLFLVIVTRPKQ